MVEKSSLCSWKMRFWHTCACVKSTLRLRLCVNGNCIAAAAALCFSELNPDIWPTPAAAAALMLDAPVRIRLETANKIPLVRCIGGVIACFKTSSYYWNSNKVWFLRRFVSTTTQSRYWSINYARNCCLFNSKECIESLPLFAIPATLLWLHLPFFAAATFIQSFIRFSHNV